MTPNKENIIKALYSLGQHKDYVSNKELAQSLKISPPSVSEMLLKLRKDDYIEYKPYKGCRLTEKGLNSAHKVVRYHRLWEVFLIERLGFSWAEAHNEAELLEHITSEHLAQRLDEFLAFPEHCPYNIITPADELSKGTPHLLPLHLIKEGQAFIVDNFFDDPELLDYLQKLHFQAGMSFTLVSQSTYGGDIKLRGDQGDIDISLMAASRIFVKLAP